MILEVQNLQKKFGKFTAIDKVSFSLNEGSIVGLIGPNGAGKTTTIKCIVGLLRPSLGKVTIMGKTISEREARSNIAYIPETPDIYNMLTVWEHIKFMAIAYNVENFEPKAEELLKKFDLTEKKNVLCKNLSKGMKQKVSICSNLIHNPKVVLVDEPMIGLDPRAIRELKDVFLHLRDEGKTILISTHLLDNAQNLCDSVIVMKKGNILEEGTIEELREKMHAAKDTSLEDLFLEVTGDEQN